MSPIIQRTHQKPRTPQLEWVKMHFIPSRDHLSRNWTKYSLSNIIKQPGKKKSSNSVKPYYFIKSTPQYNFRLNRLHYIVQSSLPLALHFFVLQALDMYTRDVYPINSGFSLLPVVSCGLSPLPATLPWHTFHCVVVFRRCYSCSSFMLGFYGGVELLQCLYLYCSTSPLVWWVALPI